MQMNKEEIKLMKVSYAELQNKLIECNIDRIRLQQENNQLKLDFELYKDNHIYKNYEVERKDRVLKELISWLKEVKEMYAQCNDDLAVAHFGSVLDKISYLEIEGGKNE